ncbi:MAG: SRPBCC domain-containing protein [Cyclobacteriaceae bacterium]
MSKASIEIDAPVSKVWEALVVPEIAKEYFFGADIISDWQEGSPITFKGSFNGNQYEEKGILLSVKPNTQLQYTHWSNLENLPDKPEHYRTWSFNLKAQENHTQLSVTEDNIPTEKQQARSDEFWQGVLLSIKQLLER